MTRAVTDVARPAHDPLATHVVEARVEDARFLIDRGVSLDRAAVRVGMTAGALLRALERHPTEEA